MNLHLWPAQERPREKLLAQGAQALSDAELLALLLGSSGLRGSNVVDLARTLLVTHHSLRELLSADRAVLLATRGLGRRRATAACRPHWNWHAGTTPRPCAVARCWILPPPRTGS